jgi:hypothetical protein
MGFDKRSGYKFVKPCVFLCSDCPNASNLKASFENTQENSNAYDYVKSNYAQMSL